MSGPLNKMGKALLDNTKLTTKLKNIGAKRTKIIENNLKLALSQVKATEKQLEKAGKLDAKTEKALKKRATLLTQIAEKEIAGIKNAEAALKEKNAATRKAAKEAEKVARANKKAEEIQNNISVIAEKNRRLALKTANVGATAVDRIKNQLKFDLESLDIQREKMKVAKRLNRDVVAGLNRQRAILREMASRQIQVIDTENVQRSTSLLGRLRDSFSRLGAGIIVFNQALELMGKAMRAFRIIFGNTVQKFADFETALIGVSKTTTLAGDTLDVFGNDIQQLSAKIPATNEELLKIAEVSGQLGVDGRQNLLNFAETMTRVAVSTNLTAEQAASDFTKILNVTRTPIDQIDEFSSVIVRLGNNFATNESKITRMTNEVARATTAFNVAAEDTAAFATAMSAMGIRAEIGGSVLARAMVRIQDALVAGGVEMQTLAKITGQTQEQLRKTFSTDATKVTREFLRGLKRMKDEGKLIIPVMADFGLKGDEVNKVLPPLVANVDSLGKAFKFAREEMKNATALAKESDKQFATLNSSINTMMNAFRTLGVEVGRAFAPFIGVLADSIKSLAQGLTFAAKGLSFFTDTIALLIKEGKTFLVVLAGIGAAFAALVGKGAAVAGALKIIGFGMAFLAGKAALASIALAGFVAAGVKLTLVAVSIGAIGAAIEILVKNIGKLRELGEFVKSVFAKVGNNLTILFNDIGAWFIRMLRDIASSLGIFGSSVVTKLNALSNQLDASSFKAKENQAGLNKEIEKTAAALDFGFTGAFIGDIKKMIAGLQEATTESGKFGAEGEKVAKIFEKRAATLAEQAKALRTLSKILKENRLLELDIQKLRGGGGNQILATLQANLDIVEAKKQLFINQRKLNDLSKEELQIVNALIKQQDLLKKKAAAALDASRPERVLKALSVEVVFGSIDGFVNGLKTVANVFDEATGGFFTAFPRALFEGFSQATEAMAPMFDSIGDVFSSALDGLSELFTNSLQEFEEFFGVDLAEVFTDLGGILSDALEGTSDFFSGLFDDANKDVEGIFNAANNVPQQVGSGENAVKGFLGFFRQAESLEQQAAKLEFEAARKLTDAGVSLEDAAQALKESAMGGGTGAANGPVAPIGPEMGGFGPVTEAQAATGAGGAAGAAAGAAGGLAAAAAIADAIQALIDFIPNLLDKIAGIFNSLVELPMKIVEGLDDVFDSILNFVANFIPNLIEAIPKIFKSFSKFLKELPKVFLQLMQELPSLLIEMMDELPLIIEGLITNLVSAGPKIALTIIEFMVKNAPRIAIRMIKLFAIQLPKAIIVGILEGLKDIGKAIGQLFTGGLDFGPLEDKAKEAVKAVERAVTGVGTQLFAVQDAAIAEKARKELKDFEGAMKRVMIKTRDIFQALWDKSFGKLSMHGLEVTLQDTWNETFGKLSMHGLEVTLQDTWNETFGKLSAHGLEATFQPVWDESFGKLSAHGMRQTFQPVWNDTFGLLSAHGMRETFQPLWNDTFGKLSAHGMRQTFQPVWNDTFGLLSKHGMEVTFQNAWDKSFGKLSLHGLQVTFQTLWDDSFGKLSSAGLLDAFQPVLDSLWGFVEFFKQVSMGNIIKGLNEFVSFFQRIGDKIVEGIKGLTGGGGGGTLKKLGRQLGFAEGGEVVKMFANGGPVFPGSTDTVPALLTPGEFVLNRKAVGSLGVQTLNRINETGKIASGDTNVSVSMTVNTTQTVDSSFIKNRIMPVMRAELKRASSDGSFVIDKRGLR